MLLSSINQLMPSAPIQAGIAIGRHHLCAVTIESSGNAWSIRNIHRHDLSAPLFTGVPTPAVAGALDAALQGLGEELKAQFALTHVALPDTVIRSSIFELDEIPKTPELQSELIRWRFAKDWQRPEDSLDCRGQDIGSAAGKRLLLAQAGDQAWIDCVKQALARAGLMPSSITAALVYRYNRFQHQFAPTDGAMLSLDPDGWTLLYWDAQQQLRRIATRLRATGDSDEINNLAGDVARIIQTGSAGKIDRLYLSGNIQDMLALGGRLEQQLGMQVTRMYGVEGVSGNIAWAREGMAPLALAAAMSS